MNQVCPKNMGVSRMFLPLFDRLKKPPQPLTLDAIHHFHEADAAFEMSSEIWMPFAVLRLGSGADAVGEDRVQSFEVAAGEAQLLVHDDSGEVLADSRAQDTGLAVIDAEAFFQRNCGDVRRETSGGAVKLFAA